MPKFVEQRVEKVPAEVLEKALELACRRVADSPQRYEEANTAEGWYEVFIRQAESATRGK